MSKEIKLSKKIKATPEEIYIALTNPFTIELWSGEPAVMSEEPGSEFSMLGGSIIGRNLSFEANKEIRQVWYFGEDVESQVTIRFFPEKTYTQVWVHHQDIPEEAYDDMLIGWKESYLESLKDFFEK